MALALQGSGVESVFWWAWLEGAAPFTEIPEGHRDALLDHMLNVQILMHLGGRLCLGVEGERRWGRRHFMDLCTQFSTPQEVEVVFQGQTLGSVDSRFALKHGDDEPLLLILGGQYWRVVSINWREHRCEVEPIESSPDAEPPVWQGAGIFWNRGLCEAMRRIVMGEEISQVWSRRARTRLESIRQHHVFNVAREQIPCRD